MATASVALTGIWLHDVADPQGTSLCLARHPFRGEDWQADVSLMRFAGRTRPVAEFGGLDDGRYRADIILTTADAQWSLMRSLVRRKGTVCARDSSGRVVFGVIPGLSEQDAVWGGQRFSIEVIETAYTEEV